MNTAQIYHNGKKITKKVDILEKDIQTMFEENILREHCGIRFLVSEYSYNDGDTRGRIDTLGIDENNSPVIIEYKRSVGDHAILQALQYRTWLRKNHDKFESIVAKKFNKQIVDWSQPRIICVGDSFRSDAIDVIQDIKGDIDLIRYQLYEDNNILIENIYTENSYPETVVMKTPYSSTTEERLQRCDDTVKNIFENIKMFLLNLDNTVKIKETKNYTAFKTNRNIAVVKIFSQKGNIRIGANVDPDSITLEDGFTEDARNIHGNDGPLHITIKTLADLERAKPILIKSFNNS
jgi:predicted transport protein